MKKLALVLLLTIGVSLAVVYGLYRAPAAQQAVETPVQTHTPRPPAAEKPTSTPTPQQVTDDIPKPTLDAGLASILETTQIDEQGAIIVEITPINSSEARNSLNFNVKLTTHSIDLTMDLTKLTTLSTDSGAPVQAILWNGPRGGHHIEGILTFPSFSGNQTLLAGATKLTIKIQDLDVPERTFTWNLQK